MIAVTILIVIFSVGTYFYLNSENEIVRIINVGSGFTAHALCSGLFVSNLSLEVLKNNEIAGIAALVFDYEINYQEKYVDAYPFTSKLFSGAFARSVFINSELGCRLEIEPELESSTLSLSFAKRHLVPSSSQATAGDLEIAINDSIQSFVDSQFTEAAFERNQTRAVAIIHKGKLIAEGYQSIIGVSKDIPLLGWSMTKSLQAAVVGAAVQNGLWNLSSPIDLDLPSGKKTVALREMLTMTDVLDFSEDYSIHASVASMLYQSGDCSSYALNVKERVAGGQESNQWYYSSGLSNLLARAFSKFFPAVQDYWSFPFTHLLHRIGAKSFTFETDAAGIFIASSFSYATARDWARLGQLFLQNGSWNGQQVVAPEVVELARTPRANSGGHYGGSFWLNPAVVSSEEYHVLPDSHQHKRRRAWLLDTLPPDTYFMSGYNGQYTFIIPSLDLVMVRLGFTPDPKPGKNASFSEALFFGTIVNLVKSQL